jgi:hypothetical protein
VCMLLRRFIFRVSESVCLAPLSDLVLPGISVGAALLAINGGALKGMTDAEVRDLSRQFPGSKIILTMRMPGVHDSRQAVERVVYFNKQQATHDGIANWQRSLFGLGAASDSGGAMNTRHDCEPQGALDHAEMGYVGLNISHTCPHRVISIVDLVDEAGRQQGHKEYSNVAVHPDDTLIRIDGQDIESKPIEEIHGMISGRMNSVVELTLQRNTTGKVYSLRARRHARHACGDKKQILHNQQAITPKTLKKILTESPCSSPNQQNHAAQVGLLLTKSQPLRVIAADDLVDEAHVRQGQRGYSNMEVLPEDELLEVDGRNVSSLDFGSVQKLLAGPPGALFVLR